MSLSVSSDWSYRGLQAIVLDNGRLRIVVLPELGGKVWELHDLASGRQLLWHHPRLTPRPVPFASGYDDVFFGGWDELFPNDVPEVVADEPYPDHGEIWTLPWSWSVESSSDAVSVTLSVSTPISTCTLTKKITLGKGDTHLRVSSSVTNLGGSDLPFMWKQHLAMNVDSPARIDMPAGDVLLGDFGSPRAGAAGEAYAWPYLVDGVGVAHDMRHTLPQSSGASEFQYATALSAGWCALTQADGTGLGLAFDPEVFRSVWTFASYGGWRGLQVAILEPCTGYPISLADGIATGTHQVLPAGSTISTSLTAAVFSGLSGVSSVSPNGTVMGVAS